MLLDLFQLNLEPAEISGTLHGGIVVGGSFTGEHGLRARGGFIPPLRHRAVHPEREERPKERHRQVAQAAVPAITGTLRGGISVSARLAGGPGVTGTLSGSLLVGASMRGDFRDELGDEEIVLVVLAAELLD